MAANLQEELNEDFSYLEVKEEDILAAIAPQPDGEYRKSLRVSYGKEVRIYPEESVGSNLNRLHKEPNNDLFPLSELSFYLRYFWREGTTAPSDSKLFAIPKYDYMNPEAYETFSVFQEIEGGSQVEGCKAFLSNKLESMTACGDFADMYINSIYFKSESEARGAFASAEINKVENVSERMNQFIEMVLKNPGESWIVKCEIDGNHVFLLEVPGGENKMWYRYESVLSSADFRISFGELTESELRKALIRRIDRLDSMRVHSFNVVHASERLSRAVEACFDEISLCSSVPYLDKEITWNEMLDKLPFTANRAIIKLKEPSVVWKNIRKLL